MDPRSDFIRRNIASIKARIAAAAARARRPASEISLLAVTKNVSLLDMRLAVEAGVRLVGENRVQEAQKKFSQIGPAVSWHMLGHLQTNKARPAAAIFDLVQSVDSPRIADALDQAARGLDRQLDVLVEVNIGGEEQKFGVSPAQTRDLAVYAAGKPNLRVRGLMAMAPYVANAELVRPFFRHLAGIFRDLRKQRELAGPWEVLSMGMTNDFEIAVEEGATLVRIGTGIFSTGERP
jgi:PLP dependent protein